MKKLLLLLLVCPLFIACSDDNNGDKGYLTSLENVKIGIVGVWKPSDEIYYYGFDSHEKKCSGFNLDELTEECGKYQIIQNSGSYLLRIFSIDDLEGNGSYVDYVIEVLNNNRLVYYSLSGGKASFTRVTSNIVAP